MRGLVGLQRQREAEIDRYTYDVLEEQQELDGAGVVKRRRTRRYEVFYVRGKPVRRQVAENGQPLPARRQAEEDRRARETVEGLVSGRVAREQAGPRLSRVLERYDFSCVAREREAGRDTLVFDFAPRPGERPLDSDRLLRALRGRVWIDEAERAVRRAELESAGPLDYGLGFGARVRRVAVTSEFRRFDDGVWLPERTESSVEGRFLLFKKFRRRTIVRYENYKRFAAETQEQLRPVAPRRDE